MRALLANCLIRGFNSGLIVDHCVFLNNVAEAIGASSNGGFRLRVTVTDSVFQRNGDGVSAGGRADIAAVRCTFAGNNVGANSQASSGSGFHPRVHLNVSGVAATSSANNTAVIYLADNMINCNTTSSGKTVARAHRWDSSAWIRRRMICLAP